MRKQLKQISRYFVLLIFLSGVAHANNLEDIIGESLDRLLATPIDVWEMMQNDIDLYQGISIWEKQSVDWDYSESDLDYVQQEKIRYKYQEYYVWQAKFNERLLDRWVVTDVKGTMVTDPEVIFKVLFVHLYPQKLGYRHSKEMNEILEKQTQALESMKTAFISAGFMDAAQQVLSDELAEQVLYGLVDKATKVVKVKKMKTVLESAKKTTGISEKVVKQLENILKEPERFIVGLELLRLVNKNNEFMDLMKQYQYKNHDYDYLSQVYISSELFLNSQKMNKVIEIAQKNFPMWDESIAVETVKRVGGSLKSKAIDIGKKISSNIFKMKMTDEKMTDEKKLQIAGLVGSINSATDISDQSMQLLKFVMDIEDISNYYNAIDNFDHYMPISKIVTCATTWRDIKTGDRTNEEFPKITILKNTQDSGSNLKLNYLVLRRNSGVEHIKTYAEDDQDIQINYPYAFLPGRNELQFLLLDEYDSDLGLDNFTESNILEMSETIVYDSILLPEERSLGFTDVYVNTQNVSFSLWDHAAIDGDSVAVILNDTTVVLPPYGLNRSRKIVDVRLRPGQNKIHFVALNEGTSSPNTASLMISDVIKGEALQEYKAKRGETATFVVEAPK